MGYKVIFAFFPPFYLGEEGKIDQGYFLHETFIIIIFFISLDVYIQISPLSKCVSLNVIFHY